MNQAQIELQYEADARYGDPRVCQTHPWIQTSSGDGMFDGVCAECENYQPEIHYLTRPSDASFASFTVLESDKIMVCCEGLTHVTTRRVARHLYRALRNDGWVL